MPNMKRLSAGIASLSLMVPLIFSTVGVVAAPIDDAGDAYNKSVYVQAIRLFRPLAEKGNSDAQAMLGMMYLKGEGTTRSYPDAMKWLLLASSQGNTGAFNNLGAMHFNGDGVTKNYPEAARLFRQSAIKGDKYGQTSLGSMYLNGHGVDKDAKEAVKWFRLAAASGDVNAVNALKRLNQ
jgi:uncharacterized protein